MRRESFASGTVQHRIDALRQFARKLMRETAAPAGRVIDSP
jgi:hypothetical protein